MKKISLIGSFFTVSILITGVAQATNGANGHGHGTKSKAMGGVGIALPQDSLVAAVNPAGMAYVGNRFDIGPAILSPPRTYANRSASNLQIGGIIPPFTEFGSDGTVTSDSNAFLIPHMGINYQLSEVSTIGFSVYGAGFGTDWPGVNPFSSGELLTGPLGGGPAAADLLHLEMVPTYTRKFGNIAVGVSGVFSYQQLEVRGASLFGLALLSSIFPGLCAADSSNRLCDNSFLVADGNADNLSNNGHDSVFGLGGKFGVMWQINETINVGFAYHSEVFQEAHDSYADMLPGGDATLNFPAQVGVGMAWRPLHGVVVAFDYMRTFFGEVDGFSQPFKNFAGCAGFNGTGGSTGERDTSSCLGGANGPGFGWTNINIYKLGVQWDLSADFTLRFGFNHGDNPVPGSEILFNVLAPGVIEDHYTIGFTKKFNKNNEFDFAFYWSPKVTVTGPSQLIDITMAQREVEMNWAIKF